MSYVSVEVEVGMSDFDTYELIEELKSRGYFCVKTSASRDNIEAVESIDFDRIEHLSTCGQKAAARLELFSMVQAVTGCDLTH